MRHAGRPGARGRAAPVLASWLALASLALGSLALGSACAGPDLGGTSFSCASHADCLDGKICGAVGGVRACVAPEQSPISVGLSAPLQGPSQDLGLEMRKGIEAYFNTVNQQGGVHGRRLELRAMNDNYDPATAAANMKQLLDIQMESPNPDSPDARGPNGVLAVLGNVGTPTMLATAPIANKNHVVFFAPFTGAQKYLRDGTNSPYVFNYRAGYYQETEAMIDYMAGFRAPAVITGPESYRRILAFTQRDSYGDAGYDSLVTAYNTRVAPVPQPDSTSPNPSIARVSYERENVASVDPAVTEAERFLADLLAAEGPTARVSAAVVMVDTYQPGNKLIRAIKDWINADLDRATRLDVLFIHLSFVGPDALAAALISAPESYLDVTDPAHQRRKTYAEGVMVTQVVPYYRSQAAGVTAYRNDLARADGGSPSFTSLEGYIAARLFVEGLRANGPFLDAASLVATFNSKVSNLDLGIGTLLNFTAQNHQASHTVWGSRIAADGSFTVPFIWDPTRRIVPGSN